MDAKKQFSCFPRWQSLLGQLGLISLADYSSARSTRLLPALERGEKTNPEVPSPRRENGIKG